MNIVFTGMRGTGKTTLGKKIAKLIQWDFVDIDKEIEKKVNKKIDQYVDEFGWEAFRKEETLVAKKCAQLEKTVISTGGGTMMNPENAAALKGNGHVVLLVCKMERLKIYLSKSYQRPSLGGEKSAIEEMHEVWAKRKDQYYEVADTIHDTSRWPSHKKLLKTLQSVESLNL
jgi:shikimate kinase